MQFISRDEWGALDSGKPLSTFKRAPEGVVVHHTTGSGVDPWQRIKQHDKYHVKTRGWKSIAYNWLVSGETGEIFEGRGWKQGAATKGQNSKTTSISYIGSGDDLTHNGKEAILTVIEALRKEYGDHLWVKCHRDFGTTYCPGDGLATWIKSGMPMVDMQTSVQLEIKLSDMESLSADFRREPLHRGSKGKNVIALQVRLNERINTQLVCDGSYGRLTEKAVREFQSMYPIRKDGRVGPVTWRYLWTV